MIKPSGLALLLALLGGPVLAQEQVKITADTFTIDEATHEAVFTGNVVVIHPSVEVHADKVVGIYGEGGTSDIQSFDATGAVRLITPDQTATGERAVFTPGTQQLRLTGNVRVTNSGGTVDASELVHNLDTNTSTFSAGSGGRVTGVFTSQ
jgi:lipopolysaccharide export system protein LptA